MRTKTLDELDRRIIKTLEVDGRASNAKVARDLGVSEGTIRRRLKTLLAKEIIRVVAYPDPVKMGFETAALVGIQVDPDKVDVVAERLAQLSEVDYVAVTTGAYDIFAWVMLPSPDDLGTFLRDKVGHVKGLRRTETFVNLSVKKRGHSLVL